MAVYRLEKNVVLCGWIYLRAVVLSVVYNQAAVGFYIRERGIGTRDIALHVE